MKCPRPKCGYEWEPRKALPKACPMCKQYIVYGDDLPSGEHPTILNPEMGHSFTSWHDERDGQAVDALDKVDDDFDFGA